MTSITDATVGGLSLPNAALPDVIDVLARQAQINHVLDPKTQGTVTLSKYGEIIAIDPKSLLDAILQLSFVRWSKEGDLYRIAAIQNTTHLSLEPQKKSIAAEIKDDD